MVDVNATAWEKDLRQLTKTLHSAEPDSRATAHAMGVIQAKTCLATLRLARWTCALAASTVVLAIATVVIALRS